MPRNGSGTYSLPQPPFVAGTVISSAAVNSDFSDIAAALTASLPRDGQAGMTGQMKAVDGSTLAPSYAFTNDLGSGFFRPGNGQIGVVISGEQVGLFDENGFEGQVKSGVPIGSILEYCGVTIPALWLLCFGQAISRTTYADLFTAVGVLYGSGDGATTFNIPDFRGTVAVGNDAMGGTAAGRLTTAIFGSDPTILGDRGGSQTVLISIAQLPTHTHANTLTDPHHTHQYQQATSGPVQNGGGGSGFGGNNGATTGDSATGITINNASVGSGTALPIVQPSLVVNKIIFAGV